MKRSFLLAAAAFPLAGAGHSADADSEQVAAAKRYFRGVYGGDPAVVQELASENIVSSYPIFASLFGTPALRGREAVRAFSARFAGRWKDSRIEFHEAIEQGTRVVLVWSLRARQVEADGEVTTDEEHAWGGITLFRFDGEGKIAAEVGEESEPGPMERLGSVNAE